MIKIEQKTKTFSLLQTSPPGELMLRHNLKDLISNSPGEFFAEIGQSLFLIDKDVQCSGASPARIDLLALDERGQAVILALAREQDASVLARAITWAGLISNWKPSDFLARLKPDQVQELRRFLEVPCDAVNHQQRAVLIAESFDFEVLGATRWLWERNGLDLTCVRVFLRVDQESQAEYIGATDLSEALAPAAAEHNSAGRALLKLAAQGQLPPSKADADSSRKPSAAGERSLVVG